MNDASEPTPGLSQDPELKRLLLSAVPALPEPEDRIGQVRARVRRGRLRTGVSAAGAVVTALAVALAVSPVIFGEEPVGETAVPADESPDHGLRAYCSEIEFETVPADWSAWPPLGAALAAELDTASMEQTMGIPGFWDRYDWRIARQTGDALDLFGAPVDGQEVDATADTGPPYAHAQFRRDGGRWVPLGWGQCSIQVSAPGWGNARFVLDPAVAPDPGSSTVSVLAWERSCASGRPPDGRAVEARVLAADEHSVSIVVLVEPVRGGAACPGNPSFPFELDLGEPLGDRVLLDASADPPLERPWPPTESSVDSQGDEE